jgi:dihydrolipoamide dehydrogenase
VSKEYDLIVIGAGSGLEISSDAAEQGWQVAVVDPGPFGGTCLNRGCIPSKAFIHVADVMEEIRQAHKFGIKGVNVDKLDVNWQAVVKRVMNPIDEEAAAIEQGNRSANIGVFKQPARFIGPRTLKVGNKVITAKNVVIAAGCRPSVPAIKGLDSISYITSDDVFRLTKLPKSIVFIGGGYIAAELAHLFGTLGTRVTIIQRSSTLLSREDDEVAEAFTKAMAAKHDVRLNAEILGVRKGKKGAIVDIKEGTKLVSVEGELLLVATGRVPNTDLLDAKAGGVQLDSRGFVVTDSQMRTSAPGVWAIGDIAGKWQFKHSANLEASYCSHNILHSGEMMHVDYTAMPHAVFSSPQLAGVGATEEELIAKKAKYLKGVYRYKDTAMGEAMLEDEGFVKIMIEPKTHKILGCHIIGPDASVLIHEVLVAMKAGLPADAITATIHIHPALNEVVQRAFASARQI